MAETSPRFYPGQNVVAVDAILGSVFKNGSVYSVSSYDYKMNPANGKWYQYIGIVGVHDWLRPGIFAPIPEIFQRISFQKVIEKEIELINVN